MTERPESILAAGTLLAGRYRVGRLLGRGGMGAVYLAEHLELRKSVALKVLLPELASVPDVVHRFLQEARAAASLRHPGIVDVIDLGQDGDTAFLVMELLDGEELADRIARDPPLTFREVARIGWLVCDAVAAAHERGIVHRDLKPANVFLVRDKEGLRIKVLDFGIAKVASTERPLLTQTGQVIGTPQYMSPEQLRDSASVDARTDVYAIGAILFEMLARRPPFLADSYPALVLAVCGEELPDLRRYRPDVPPALEAIVRAALEKTTEARTQSAVLLGAALRPFERSAEVGALDATLAHPTDSLAPGPSSTKQPVPSTTVPEGPAPSPPPSLSRSPAVIAVGAFAAVGALAALAATWASAGPRVEPDPTVSSAAPTGPAALDIEPTSPTGPIVEASPHHLEIDVDPIGALVRDANGESCRAPCVLSLPERATVLTVSAEGRVAQEVSLALPLPGRVELTLPRAPRRAGGRTDPPPPLRAP